MTKDEALRLALAALSSGEDMQIGRVVWTEYDSSLVQEAITAIKEALAQPEQKPVYKYCDDGKVIFTNPEILSRRPNKEKT